MAGNADFVDAMTLRLPDELPSYPEMDSNVRRAPHRGFRLTHRETELALRNALRYVPPSMHETLAPEFLEELTTRGRIYAYRFRPEGRIRGLPVESYRGKCLEGRALQVMLDNNLDFEVAQYPYELVTYGESGQACQNWLQYRLIKRCLEELTSETTLAVASGHPVGLFRSTRESPRVIATNGLMVGMYDDQDSWAKAAALGVTNYGQMTAGGWFFIGPQGIIHGCYGMLLNSSRKRGISASGDDLRGISYITAGLGSISAAQGKAAQIARCFAVVAEVNRKCIDRCLERGWIDGCSGNPDEIFRRGEEARRRGEGLVLAYHGNVVDLLDFVLRHDVPAEILSDQTSCHIPYDGGYTPQGLSFEEGRELLRADREAFRARVDRSLRRHFELLKSLTDRGSYFLEYGNSLMDAMLRAGVTEVARNGKDASGGFVFPDFIDAVTGPELFDYGYGPFRWVCLSGDPEDLRRTDAAALACIDPNRRPQDRDNANWIRGAAENGLVVGTQARMLYQDAAGRIRIALRFNDMVRRGEVGPLMIGRDHHDTAGADCPLRETSNIKDGSNVTADMAAHCFAGDAARGMTFVALHNGGGMGIGRSIHTGFSLLLDGSERVDDVIRVGINWDVMGGIARRAWGRNPHSLEVAAEHNRTSGDRITLPFPADDDLVRHVVARVLGPESA